MRRIALVIACGVPWTMHAAGAGAWTLDEGQVQILAGVTYSTAAGAFDAKGRLSQPAAYWKVLGQVHAEYGVRDWLSLIAAPDYADASLVAVHVPKQTARDFSFEAGARLRLLRENGPLSVQFTAKTAGAFDTTVSADGAPAQQIELRLLYGRGFTVLHRHAFVDIEAGQRWISGRRADEFPLDLTLGVDVTPRDQVLLQCFNVVAEGNARPPYGYYRVHKLGFSSVHRLWKGIRLEVGGYIAPAGQNALAERGYTLRIWTNL